jgi:hypothetical protein
VTAMLLLIHWLARRLDNIAERLWNCSARRLQQRGWSRTGSLRRRWVRLAPAPREDVW